jgi:hypothetical protein
MTPRSSDRHTAGAQIASSPWFSARPTATAPPVAGPPQLNGGHDDQLLYHDSHTMGFPLTRRDGDCFHWVR